MYLRIETVEDLTYKNNRAEEHSQNLLVAGVLWHQIHGLLKHQHDTIYITTTNKKITQNRHWKITLHGMQVPYMEGLLKQNSNILKSQTEWTASRTYPVIWSETWQGQLVATKYTKLRCSSTWSVAYIHVGNSTDQIWTKNTQHTFSRSVSGWAKLSNTNFISTHSSSHLNSWRYLQHNRFARI